MIAAAEGGIYHGIQGLREWAEAVDSIFDRFNHELIDFRELDAERAFVVVRLTGQAKASGVPVDERFAQIWTWRNGKMWRNEVFTDLREALKAALRSSRSLGRHHGHVTSAGCAVPPKGTRRDRGGTGPGTRGACSQADRSRPSPLRLVVAVGASAQAHRLEVSVGLVRPPPGGVNLTLR